VPVAVDGVPTAVAVSVVCDPPEVAVMPTSVRKPSGQSALPVTGSSSGGLITGAALVAAGMAVSLIARRRYS
ncbi:MAG: hypothetical protein Q7V62_07310, partial [Actinomycetota bacterium]|nr:hypothetical protein [Actinomycetota bacterium]